MAGVREKFRNNFNPLAAMEARRCPPRDSDRAEGGSI